MSLDPRLLKPKQQQSYVSTVSVVSANGQGPRFELFLRPDGLRDYNKIKTLGQGSFGHVLLCEHKDTKVKRAVKVLRKSAFVDEIHKNLLMNELAIAR
jgi:serine/threonine protein kinase